MEDNRKRSQEKIEEKLPTKQPKFDDSERDHPGKKFLEPHQAFEIYAALPIAHQLRLLALWRSIYEDEPIPDEWTRWKIFTWADNKWNANDCGRGIDLSSDGLAISRNDQILEGSVQMHIIRAIQPAVFSLVAFTAKQPIHVCYFEAKIVHRFLFSIGFYGGSTDLNSGCNARDSSNPDKFGMFCDGVGFPGRWNLHTRFRAGDVVGCGLLKHLGKRRIFFTKNGELLASVPIPIDAPNQLFPAVTVDNHPGKRFEDTNFGLKPFRFKYAPGKEGKLLNGLGRDFEVEEAA